MYIKQVMASLIKYTCKIQTVGFLFNDKPKKFDVTSDKKTERRLCIKSYLNLVKIFNTS